MITISLWVFWVLMASLAMGNIVVIIVLLLILKQIENLIHVGEK